MEFQAEGKTHDLILSTYRHKF